MTIPCRYETLSLLFLLVPESIWVRIWKTRHVLRHKENSTESSFTSLSFSLASGLKSGTIDLPCWRYWTGKPAKHTNAWMKDTVGAHKGPRVLVKRNCHLLTFSGMFSRCIPFCCKPKGEVVRSWLLETVGDKRIGEHALDLRLALGTGSCLGVLMASHIFVGRLEVPWVAWPLGCGQGEMRANEEIHQLQC